MKLPTDKEIEGWLMNNCGGASEESAQIRSEMRRGAKWMRSIAEKELEEMREEIKRLNSLLQQHIEFRADCTALNDPSITEIDDKHFPF